jgi:glutamyl-tRNA reductase
MVIGENEILCQIKQAYRDSVHQGMSGIILNRLFHQAFNTAKKVRTETAISQNPLSIAYIAVEQVKDIFKEGIAAKKTLLVGAGEMGELILKYLLKCDLSDITIANRTMKNAEEISLAINKSIKIIPLDLIEENLAEIDILITSATCHDYIISKDILERVQAKREGRPIYIIDIAVPRNVDPMVSDTKGIFLLNIDDLKSISGANMQNRLQEVERADKIIHEDAEDLIEWYQGLEIVPAITKVQSTLESIRKSETQKYRRRKLKNLSEDDFKIVEELTKQIISKALHNPIMAIKGQSNAAKTETEKYEVKRKLAVLEELFR